MASCQVYYVNIVTYTCSIRGIIVISEDTDTFQFSDGNLCHIRKQVVRDSLRILSDTSTFMCSYRVEIAKKNNIHIWIGLLYIRHYLLQHGLSLSIRVGRVLLRAFLTDRNLQRITIYGSRRTEDNIFASMFSHGVTEKQGSGHIIVIILNRFRHGFSYCFISCKMNDCIRLFSLKNLVHCRLVQHIGIIKF